jgi:preprotein translocase subunit YajC
VNGLFVPLAAQQAAPPSQGFDMSFFAMMGVIFAIFYFLVLRPQQKKQRALEDAVKSAARGDQIVTSGGLHGRVVATEADVLTVEIAKLKGGQTVNVQVSRSGITSVTRKKGEEKGEES